MLALLACSLLVVCSSTLFSPSASGPGSSLPEGFATLFNGENLDGWVVRQAENRDWPRTSDRRSARAHSVLAPPLC